MFLKRSQCDGGPGGIPPGGIPHVCCARNDDSLIFGLSDDNQINGKSFDLPSVQPVANVVPQSEYTDDSIIYKSSNSLLPKHNECGREKIENRIYSGQVSCSFLLCLF